MQITQDRKSEIVLDLLKELMSSMKGSAGSKLKPKEPQGVIEVEIEHEPVEMDMDHDEDELKEDDHDGDKDELEGYDGADLEDVLDKASEDEPASAASKRLAKLAASNKR